MQLLFEVKPFYDESMEGSLPDKDATIAHFLAFLDEYNSITKRVQVAYSAQQNNKMFAFGAKSTKLVKSEDIDNYEDLHKYRHLLHDYYALLLIAAKNKHNVWLNDCIQNKGSEKGKTRRKKV